jgi:hypothetical protein
LFVLGIILCIYVYDDNKISLERKRALNSFTIANAGLLSQKQKSENANKEILSSLMNEAKQNPNDTTNRIVQNAQQVSSLSNELNDWIESMKIDIVVMMDGCDSIKAKERVLYPFKIANKGSYKKSNYFFGTDRPPGSSGRAHDLKDKIEKYREKLFSFVTNPDDLDKIKKRLNKLYLEAPEEQSSWEMFYFYDLPLSAALVELTKYQTIIRDAETALLNYLAENISDGN